MKYLGVQTISQRAKAHYGYNSTSDFVCVPRRKPTCPCFNGSDFLPANAYAATIFSRQPYVISRPIALIGTLFQALPAAHLAAFDQKANRKKHLLEGLVSNDHRFNSHQLVVEYVWPGNSEQATARFTVGAHPVEKHSCQLEDCAPAVRACDLCDVILGGLLKLWVPRRRSSLSID